MAAPAARDVDYRAMILRTALVVFLVLYGGQTWRHYQSSAMPRLQAENQQLGTDLAALRLERDRLQAEHQALQDLREGLAGDKEALTAEVDRLRSEVEQAKRDAAKARADAVPLRQKAEERAKALHEAQQKISEMDSRIGALEQKNSSLALRNEELGAAVAEAERRAEANAPATGWESVRRGMTRTQLKAVLGEPDQVEKVGYWERLIYGSASVDIDMTNGRVDRIDGPSN